MFLVLAAFLNWSAFAAPSAPVEREVLDCNTSIGPDQEFKVVKRDGALVLKELTMTGTWIERAMKESELNPGPISLTDDRGTTTDIWFTPHGWWIQTQNDDNTYRENAEADCEAFPPISLKN